MPRNRLGDDASCAKDFRPDAMSRRDFVSLTAAAGGATLLAGGKALAQDRPVPPLPQQGTTAAGDGGLLHPGGLGGGRGPLGGAVDAVDAAAAVVVAGAARG